MSDDGKVVRLDDFRRPRTSNVTPLRRIPRNPSRFMAEIVRIMSGQVDNETRKQMVFRAGLCMTFSDRLDAYQLDQNEAKIREQEQLIEGYFDDEIFGVMSKATDINLLTKPHFYTALLRVARRRV